MSVARFTSSGNIKISKGVKKVKVTFNISWIDNQDDFGIGLSSASMSQEGQGFSWSRSKSNTSGSATRSANLYATKDSVKEWSISYKKRDQDSTGNSGPESSTTPGAKKSDKKIVFYDQDGTDANATITISVSGVEYFDSTPPETTNPEDNYIPPSITSCPAPTPWSSLLPTCGSPPPGVTDSAGLQISKTGNNQITLNLKNYANQLVTLKITHQVASGTIWTQSFGFNIPTCSDISPNTGGTPYAKSSYLNSSISGTNIFYAYNIDGGDYNYTFTSSSIPGPRPTRTNYNLVCTTTQSTNSTGGTDTVETCSCVPYTETYTGTWPHCPTGVAISKNGGNKVQWQYEDGGGGNYDDQYITVEVISTRNAIPASGSICTSSLKNNVWVPDTGDTTHVGNCISDYKDHSTGFTEKRFRVPALQTSKTTFVNSTTKNVCYSEFRNVAGANPPGTAVGSISGQYSVLHLYDRDFLKTSSLVSSNGITVVEKNPTDTYISTYGATTPTSDTSLNTTSRKHYEITFTDGTTVNDTNASNISIITGQDLTAGGLGDGTAKLQVLKKERIGSDTTKMRVWFYMSLKEDVDKTNDVVHVFDETTDTTTTADSDLGSTADGVIITPKNLTSTGGGALNESGDRYYEIEFSDGTKIASTDPSANSITILINQNKTGSGLTFPIAVSKKERVSDTKINVWFTKYDSTVTTNNGFENTFVRDWSILRSLEVNYTGNQFARSWSLKDTSGA